MRVLVTGGAGYIGSNLVDTLMAEGHEVRVVDDLSVGKIENIQHHLSDHRFHFSHDTILNRPLMEQLICTADHVYHLAAVVGVTYVVNDPARCIRTNVVGAEVVLENAFRYGKRTVIVSSSEVYGKSTALPLKEDGDCLMGPTTVPRWSYALSKAIDEHLALEYARQGLEVSVVRYFNSYGPRLDPRGYGSVVARFITQALLGQPITVYDDGQQTRCFTYVGDTVRGTALAGSVPEAVGQVFNIGSHFEIRIADLAKSIRELAGSASEIVHIPARSAFGDSFEETRRRVPDVHKATEILGFRADTPLAEGLQRTIDWFRIHDA